MMDAARVRVTHGRQGVEQAGRQPCRWKSAPAPASGHGAGARTGGVMLVSHEHQSQAATSVSVTCGGPRCQSDAAPQTENRIEHGAGRIRA